MNDMMRQRIWVVAVSVLAILNLAQFATNRALRAQLNESRAAVTELRKQIDERARTLLAESLRERRAEIIAAGYWLHSFYQSDEGLRRSEGLWINGRPDFEGIGAWLFDVYLSDRLLGTSDEAAKQKVVEAIKQTDEWRQKHPSGN